MPEPEIIAFRLTPEQERVLGCLIEKAVTTPATYPMSLNSIRVACNQTTNRDPVVDYDERTVQDTLDGLRNLSLVARSKAPGERAIKFRHLLPDVLELTGGEQAVVCTLLLRGPQTPGELKSRGDRMHQFAAVGEVHTALGDLSTRGIVRELERRSGQRETRWMHLLGDSS
ncbi:MAG TPA: YceH family protein [Acidimicrobiia bacterium]|jgi:hypothetical protein